MPPAIETDDLTKRFDDTAVVSNLDLTVPAESVYGFLGPNGAGKTTTMRMLTTLVRPTSGSARVADHSIDRRDEVVSHIGFLPEEPPLYDELTAREQLRYVAGLRDLDRDDRIERLLGRFDLADDADKRVSTYSKGMKQKTALIQAYLVAVSSETFGRFLLRVFPLLGRAPTAWFGDLLAAGIPGVSPLPLRIAGAVTLFALGVPVLVALDVRAATRLWYADRAQPGTRTHRSSGSNAAFLARIASGPTRAVVAKVWRRTARAPLRLVYVAYPIFLLFAPLQEAVVSRTIPASLPVLLALYGTWAIGAAALNPLGDEGALLPVTLTAGVRGAEFVRGHVLAVTTVGLPLIVAVTAITGALSPLAPSTWLLLTLASVILCVVGPVVALAVGVLFPRFGTVRVTQSRRVVVPSTTAFACYTLVLALGFVGGAVVLIPGAAAILGSGIGIVSRLLGIPLDVGAPTLRVLGGGVAVAVGVVAPLAAYRYVVGRFESYTLA